MVIKTSTCPNCGRTHKKKWIVLAGTEAAFIEFLDTIPDALICNACHKALRGRGTPTPLNAGQRAN